MNDKRYLFRGFHPDENGNTIITFNGEKIRGDWWYGDLICAGKLTYIHPKCNSFQTKGDLSKLLITHPVIPETVGQWVTTDKNGKDAFEGDKIKSHYANTGVGKDTHIETIVRFGTAFMAEAQLSGGGTLHAMLYNGVPHFSRDKSVYMDEFEVIGNKWEVQE